MRDTDRTYERSAHSLQDRSSILHRTRKMEAQRGGFMRPLLKWAGGKARLAASIRDALGGPCSGTYFEPFVGSGAVYLHLRAEGHVRNAVLADVNSKLIEMHRAIQTQVDDVLAELEAFPIEDWRDAYYGVREAFNEGPWVGPKHAARFIWLNRTGFNGLYRENRSGKFNVPIGRYAKVGIPDEAHFRAVSALLQDAELITAPFQEILQNVRAGDQVYCDPPYVPLSQTASFTTYAGGGFGQVEQEVLADMARLAAIRGATVVLSNHDLPVVRTDLYPVAKGFEYVARPMVSRAISRKGKSRGKVGEVIARIDRASHQAARISA